MKENCFACDLNKRKCTVLTETVCEKRSSCPFFKTPEQFTADSVNVAKDEE